MMGHRYVWILASLLLCNPLGAWADEPGEAGEEPGAVAVPTIPPEEEAEAVPEGIEAITVTAEKRAADVQDTALSISAFSSNDLQRLGIQQTEDIANFTPGLQINQSLSPIHTQAFIRGVGQGDFHVAVQSRVAFYVDGVYIGPQTGNAQTLLDLERVEVLRGPQGTLYGRNTIGGLINLVTEKPTPDFGAKIQLGAGSDDLYQGKGFVNFPLFHESLAARIGYFRSKRDPYFTNKFGRDNLLNLNRWGIRTALRWTPTERLTLDYTFDRTSVDEGEHGAYPTQVVRSLGGVPTLPFLTFRQITGGAVPIDAPAFPELVAGLNAIDAQAPLKQDSDPLAQGGTMPNGDHPRFDATIWLHSVTATYDLNEAIQLKSISSWRKMHEGGASDLDGSALKLLEGWDHVKHDQFMQELQAVGTLFDGKLDFATGANWFQDKYEHRTTAYVLPGCGNFALNQLALGLPACTPNDPPLSSPNSDIKGDGWAWGVYSQLGWHITDRLTLSGGIRYTYERKRAIFPNISVNGRRFDDADRYDAWTPMARLEYRLTDDILTYLGWSRGYQSGGFDQRPSLAATTTGGFDEENLYAWEAGVKSQWLDNRLQVNVGGFYYDWDDRQVQIFDPITFTGVIQNAGKSRVRGFEIELRALPLPGLDVRLGHSWTYDDISEHFDINPATGQRINRASMKSCLPGNAVCPTRPNSAMPTRQFSGDVSYTLPPFDFGTLTLGGSFVRTGAIRWGAATLQPETLGVEAGSYTVYNARVQLNDVLGRDSLYLAFVGENLSDRVYSSTGSNTSDSLGLNNTQFGPPRRVRFEVGMAFGSAR